MSWSVSVDISDALEASRVADEEFLALPRRMASVVKVAAAFELGVKSYVDRTGNARRSTKGYIDRTSVSETVAVLEAGAEYASYLRDRGFSHIDDAGRAAEAAMGDLVADIERKVK